MTEEQPKKSAAQIRAEKRRQRILGRGAAGAAQISGDRIAPGLDFPHPGKDSSGIGNEEFEKQIEKIMANAPNNGGKRNLATSQNHLVKNRLPSYNQVIFNDSWGYYGPIQPLL